MEFQELLTLSPIAVPVILVVMAVVKQYQPLKKFIPIISMVAGIGIAILVNFGWGIWLNIFQAIVVWFLLGGSTTWVYEAGKNLLNKENSDVSNPVV